MGCLSQEDFGEIKAAIEKLCSEPGRCTYEFKKKFQAFLKKHDKTMEKLPKKPNKLYWNYYLDQSPLVGNP